MRNLFSFLGMYFFIFSAVKQGFYILVVHDTVTPELGLSEIKKRMNIILLTISHMKAQFVLSDNGGLTIFLFQSCLMFTP